MLRKAAGQMHKFIGYWDKKKERKEKLSSPQPTIHSGKPRFLSNTEGLTTDYITRRQIVLNRHFTEIISDVLANNLQKDLIDMGINITSIETKAWNKGIDVYYSMDKQVNESTQSELNSLISKLRYAITERRLIGRTPMINFVYDDAYALQQNLNRVLQMTEKHDPDLEVSVMKSSLDQLQKTQKMNKKIESEFNTNRFSAPGDMSNMMLGLNYPELHNEVTAKLERGRAQSSRVPSQASLLSSQPLINIPFINDNEDDPSMRIIQMQKFLISQRKKNEYHSKLKRKQQLFARDDIKWDLPPEEEEESDD